MPLLAPAYTQPAYYRLIALLGALMCPIAIFSGVAIVPTFVALCLLMAFYASNFSGFVPSRTTTTRFVLALIGYGFINCLWSLDANSGTMTCIKFFTIYILFSMAKRLAPQIAAHSAGLLRISFIGFAFAMLIAASEILSNAYITSLFQYALDNAGRANTATLNKSSVFIGFMVWPMVHWLMHCGKKWQAWLTWFLAALLIFSMQSATSFLGFAIASLVYGASQIMPRRWLIFCLSLGITVYSFSLPFVLHKLPIYEYANKIPAAVDSVSPKARLLIYRFTSDRILEKPWLGWGVGSSKSMEEYAKTDPVFSTIEGAMILNHPHNGTLQVYLELGVVGMLFFVGLYLATMRRVAAFADPLHFSAAIALLMHFWGTQQTGFGVWQNWHWCAALIAAIWLQIAHHSNGRSSAP